MPYLTETEHSKLLYKIDKLEADNELLKLVIDQKNEQIKNAEQYIEKLENQTD